MSNTNYSRYKDSILLLFFYTYTQCGLSIEPELNAALAERFGDYNPNLQKFTTSQPKIDLNDTPKIKQQLKNLYYSRFKNNLAEIPENLNKVIAYYFNSYNPETKRFKPHTKSYADCADNTLRSAYNECKKQKLPIPEELNAELAKRFSNYNPETKTFIPQPKPCSITDPKQALLNKISSITDLSVKSDTFLQNLYKDCIKNGIPLPDQLHKEMIKRFYNYDPESQTFQKKQMKKAYSKYANDYIRLLYNKYKQNNLPIPDDLNKALGKRFSDYDPEQQQFDRLGKELRAAEQEKKIRKIVTSSKNGELIVSVKTVNIKDHIKYNDVFINGTKILSNHIYTEIKLLCDNTILAIHGIITNDPHYPDTPTWLAYNANIESLNTTKLQKYSKHYIQIRCINDANDNINMLLNDKTTVIISKDKIKKLAAGRRFIFTTKTR